MKTNLFLIIMSIIFNFSLSVTNLAFYLQPNEDLCLDEYFSDKTLVIYDVVFNTTNASVKITDPEDKIMMDKERLSEFKEAFTTFTGGYYEICIVNKDRENVSEVHFQMRHGVAAKDYSSVAKTKDLKPMELDVNNH
jgi:hypothetical protein